MSFGFLPRTDNALLAWARHFAEKLNSAPGDYGVTPQQAVDVLDATELYASALSQCDPNIRNKVSVSAKNAKRSALKRLAASLGKTIEANLNVTDDLKINLGLTVPGSRSKTPAPRSPPALFVISVRHNTVLLGLQQAGEDTGLRGKPRNVSGALVFSHVGDQPPTEREQWKYEAIVSKTKLAVTFPPSVTAGAKVWLTAAWFSHRMQTGPSSNPVSTNLQGGGAKVVNAIRLAA